MKKIIPICLCALALASCNGVINMSSESSTNSENSVSIKSETVSNGDTTMTNYDKKEKKHSENQKRTRIGFSVDDETGIADEVRRNLKKRRGADSTDTDDDAPIRKSKDKKSNSNVDLKASIDCEAGISADEFLNLKEKVIKTMMDADKAKKAKVLFNDRCITSKQAQQLISILQMEDKKLDLAKFLYGRTLDKDKFMRVAEEFSFGDSKKKLADYINN